MNKTVQLNRGYVDHDGNAHTEVTLRVPTMRDEVAAELEAREAGFGVDSAYFECAMLVQCIDEWDGLADVAINHVLALRRADARALRVALGELENSDVEAQTSGNSPDGEG